MTRYNRLMESISEFDLSWIQPLLFWAILLLLVYVAIGAAWGSWLGRLKDELGRTPTFSESLQRLVGRFRNP